MRKTTLMLLMAVVVVSAVVVSIVVRPFDWQRPSAEAAVTEACNKLASIGSYDAVARMTGTEDGVAKEPGLTMQSSFEGRNFHTRVTEEKGGWSDEVISVDGTLYWRYGNETWSHSYGSEPTDANSPAFPWCTALGEAKDLGRSRTQDGVLASHYSDASPLWATSTIFVEPPLEATPEDTRRRSDLYEYWIDSDGRLVQFRHVAHVTDTVAGEPTIQEFSLLYALSGFGEPNVITAPSDTEASP